MLVKVWKKKDDANRMKRLEAAGVDIDKTYNEAELAKGNEMIFGTFGVKVKCLIVYGSFRPERL